MLYPYPKLRCVCVCAMITLLQAGRQLFCGHRWSLADLVQKATMGVGLEAWNLTNHTMWK